MRRPIHGSFMNPMGYCKPLVKRLGNSPFSLFYFCPTFCETSCNWNSHQTSSPLAYSDWSIRMAATSASTILAVFSACLAKSMHTIYHFQTREESIGLIWMVNSTALELSLCTYRSATCKSYSSGNGQTCIIMNLAILSYCNLHTYLNICCESYYFIHIL